MAAPTKATVTKTSDREFRVERIFNASRDRVWKAMTRIEYLSQWWGRGNPLDIERYEFRKGGHWRFVEHAHGEAHGFEGRFREINAPDHTSQTFEWDGMPGHVIINTSTLEDLGDGRTKMIGTSLFHTPEDCDGMLNSGMEGGMNESYQALDRLLERLG